MGIRSGLCKEGAESQVCHVTCQEVFREDLDLHQRLLTPNLLFSS